MDKITKTILNSLKCPICKSQIDLYDYNQKSSKSTSYNFCCATSYDHYRIWFPHWDFPPKIHYDVVEVYDGRYKFQIDQRYLINRTRIDIWEVDAEHHLINEKSKTFTTFTYQKIFFDYPTTNREKIANRIKTILTFQ